MKKKQSVFRIRHAFHIDWGCHEGAAADGKAAIRLPSYGIRAVGGTLSAKTWDILIVGYNWAAGIVLSMVPV